MKVYELLIEENPNSELEVNFVAGVDRPAIERNFLVFKENKPKMKFASVEGDGSFIIGPAMIPDMLIDRVADDGTEYQVFFSAATIGSIAEKFFEKGFQHNFNLMHDPEQQKDGVTFFQSFIKDTAKGIVGFNDDLPDGTWYLGAKVKNEEVKALVKSGEIKGWSVEGLFKYKQKPVANSDVFQQIADILSGISA